MFTGIIGYVGSVVRVLPAPGGGRRLRIDLGPLATGLADGDSVAVNGACLTACSIAGREAEFDAVAETVGRTNLAGLSPRRKVNLERALELGDRLDGHLVQGHVDGLASLAGAEKGGQVLMTFKAPRELTDQMAPKGSVALDGVSLTLVDVAGGAFSVAVIPETLSRTTLGSLRPGQEVNVETDVLGKYVRRYLSTLGAGGGVTLEKLRDAGFA